MTDTGWNRANACHAENRSGLHHGRAVTIHLDRVENLLGSQRQLPKENNAILGVTNQALHRSVTHRRLKSENVSNF